MNMRSVALFVLLLAGVVGATPAVAGRHGNNSPADSRADSRADRIAYSRADSRADSRAVDGAAARDSGNDRRGDAVDSSGGDGVARLPVRVSMDDAVGRVLSAYGGRVVAASSIAGPRGMGYRIRVLQVDGRVRTVLLDASSGAMHESN